MTTPSQNGEKSWLDCFGWQVPMTILLVTLLTTNILQFVGLIQQHSSLSRPAAELSRPEVQSQLLQADMIRRKLQELAREIVVLAPTDPAAKKIQDDFHIQMNGTR